MLRLGLLAAGLQVAQAAHHWAQVKAIAGEGDNRIALVNGKHFTNGQVQWVKSVDLKGIFAMRCMGFEDDAVLLSTQPPNGIYRCRTGERVALYLPDPQPAPVALPSVPAVSIPNPGAMIQHAVDAMKDAGQEAIARVEELAEKRAKEEQAKEWREWLRFVLGILISAGLVFGCIYLLLSSLIGKWWHERRMFHYVENAPAVRSYVPTPIAGLPAAEAPADDPAPGSEAAAWRALEKLAKSESGRHQRRL